MSDDPAADLQSSRVIERAQAQIEAAARAQRDAKWDGYCGLVQACDEDEGWGEFLAMLRREQVGIDNEEEAFSPEALSALRERLEALRCAAVSAAVAPARSVGAAKDEARAGPPAAAAAAAASPAESSDAAYSAAVERVRAGDMRGAASLLRDAAFVEERPMAKARIAKYLSAVEARALRVSSKK